MNRIELKKDIKKKGVISLLFHFILYIINKHHHPHYLFLTKIEI